jgi:hypothetical protein
MRPVISLSHKRPDYGVLILSTVKSVKSFAVRKLAVRLKAKLPSINRWVLAISTMVATGVYKKAIRNDKGDSLIL